MYKLAGYQSAESGGMNIRNDRLGEPGISGNNYAEQSLDCVQ